MEKRSDIRLHCPEVENLMGGKMPFITRYGITLVVVALIAVVFILYISGGSPHQLMKENDREHSGANKTKNPVIVEL